MLFSSGVISDNRTRISLTQLGSASDCYVVGFMINNSLEIKGEIVAAPDFRMNLFGVRIFGRILSFGVSNLSACTSPLMMIASLVAGSLLLMMDGIDNSVRCKCCYLLFLCEKKIAAQTADPVRESESEVISVAWDMESISITITITYQHFALSLAS